MGWSVCSGTGGQFILEKGGQFDRFFTNATALIMIHNHPSGSLKASEADRQITRKVKEAGKLLDISLLDSLIITPESYYSFADEGTI